MGNVLKFDYYYGVEAEQFSFYRIPRILMKDKRFKTLSSDAKLLYGLMLDRMSVSIKNDWLDEENRAYIYYTVENIMEDLGCSRGSCSKILSELDSKKGIGLIERKRQGLGKPDIIYVKNFVTAEELDEEDNKEKETMDNSMDCQSSNNPTSGITENEFQEVQNLDVKKSKNQMSRSSKNGFQEIQNLDFLKSKNRTSRSLKNEPNYININYNNYSYNNPNHIDIESNQLEPIEDNDKDMDKMDWMDNTHAYIQLIKHNIDYDSFMQYGEWKKRELYDELFEVICDVICVPRESVRIGKEEYPYQLVKAKFLKLRSQHLEYVIECMQNTGTKIGSLKAYMITALYNAPNTISHYYHQEAKQDMYGSV